MSRFSDVTVNDVSAPSQLLADRIDSENKAFYTAEALAYDRRRFASDRGRRYQQWELDAILSLLGPVTGQLVLDQPCGTGRIASSLLAAGASVIGGDLSGEMLKAAMGGMVGSASMIQSNIRASPFASGSVDVVVCIRFLHLLPPRLWPLYVSELHRVLRPEGRLLLQLFNPAYGAGLELARRVRDRLLGKPQEQYIWPRQLRRLLEGFSGFSVTAFWLPGMGLFSVDSRAGEFLRGIAAQPPFSWVAGPWMVLAQKEAG